jgi:hypothetical protein
MYYSFSCTYCGRSFYTFNNNKSAAAATLYTAIKQHLIDYGEDEKEYEMDDGHQMDTDQIYAGMVGYDEEPGGWEV